MKYFKIEEFIRSNTAKARGIDNTPGSDIVAKLTDLVDNTLDPLREIYGKPIHVNSGYRCPALNKAVGGASNSGHMYGVAADIDAGSKTQNQRLWRLVIDNNIPFTKMINEQDYSWIHIAFDASNVSKTKLKAVKQNGRWVYYNV